jgi:hypothetical protein
MCELRAAAHHAGDDLDNAAAPAAQAVDVEFSMPVFSSRLSCHGSVGEWRRPIKMIKTTRLDLFAGIAIVDYATAVKWYEDLLGSVPAFFPHDTEAVWEVAPNRYVYIVQQPEHAGHARLTLFVDDVDSIVGQIGSRGIDPAKQETYANGVRKLSYRDADGNEIAFGGAVG